MGLGGIIQYFLRNVDEGKHEFGRLARHRVNDTLLDLEKFECCHHLVVHVFHGLEILDLLLKVKVSTDHLIQFLSTQHLIHREYLADQINVSGFYQIVDAVLDFRFTLGRVILA